MPLQSDPGDSGFSKALGFRKKSGFDNPLGCMPGPAEFPFQLVLAWHRRFSGAVKARGRVLVHWGVFGLDPDGWLMRIVIFDPKPKTNEITDVDKQKQQKQKSNFWSQ